MGNMVANILNRKTTQPKSPITSPPLSGPGSGHAPPNLPSNIESKGAGPFGYNETDSNDLSCVTVNLLPAQGAGAISVFDVPVFLPRASRRIMIASIGPAEAFNSAGLWLSLRPTGIVSPSPTLIYTPTGNEPWIQLRSSENAAVTFLEGTILEFRKAITRLYLSASAAEFDSDPDVAMNVTIMLADDICEFTWRPQANTAG